MKTLAVDIETAPNVADVWALFNQNIGVTQLRESARVLCVSARWFDAPRAAFLSEWGTGGRDKMLQAVHGMLDKADTVVHYNGKRFDIPHLNREFLTAGLAPPSPFKQVDLYKEVRKAFSFPSYKLAYVAKALGVGEKIEHEGHDLWVKVLAGDPRARARMRRYNIRDTDLLIPLYHKLQPWISTPNFGAMSGEDVCPGCGSANLRREGHAYTQTGRYQRFVCNDCGKWSRATRRDAATQITSVGA